MMLCKFYRFSDCNGFREFGSGAGNWEELMKNGFWSVNAC